MRRCSSISRARSFRVQVRGNAAIVTSMDRGMSMDMATDMSMGIPAGTLMRMARRINAAAVTIRTNYNGKHRCSGAFLTGIIIIKNYI